MFVRFPPVPWLRDRFAASAVLIVLAISGCAKREPESSAAPSDLAVDDIHAIEAELDRNESDLTAQGIRLPMPELAEDADAPAETPPSEAGAAAEGELQPPAEPDVAASAPAPAPAAPSARDEERGHDKRSETKQDDRRSRICDLAHVTCDLADRICGLAEHHKDDLRYQDACVRAEDQCRAASSACSSG